MLWQQSPQKIGGIWHTTSPPFQILEGIHPLHPPRCWGLWWIGSLHVQNLKSGTSNTVKIAKVVLLKQQRDVCCVVTSHGFSMLYWLHVAVKNKWMWINCSFFISWRLLDSTYCRSRTTSNYTGVGSFKTLEQNRWGVNCQWSLESSRESEGAVVSSPSVVRAKVSYAKAFYAVWESEVGFPEIPGWIVSFWCWKW